MKKLNECMAVTGHQRVLSFVCVCVLVGVQDRKSGTAELEAHKAPVHGVIGVAMHNPRHNICSAHTPGCRNFTKHLRTGVVTQWTFCKD